MEKIIDKIVLRKYPKAIFLYPLFIATIGAWICQWSVNQVDLYLFGFSPKVINTWLSIFWLGTLFFCFFVISIEIKLSKLFLVIFAIVLVGIILYLTPLGPIFIDSIISMGNIQLALPHLFYISVFSILLIILGGIIIGARINYIKIERNEIWRVKGIIGKSIERFPTRAVQINVERSDFLEYWLGTGCITIKIPSMNEFIKLDTIFRAGSKVKKIDKLLSSIDVVETSQRM